MTIGNARQANLWFAVLVILGLLLVPAVLCNGYVLLTALGFSSGVPVWGWQQYARLTVEFVFPLVYWGLFLNIRQRRWVTLVLLALAIASLLSFAIMLASVFAITAS